MIWPFKSRHGSILDAKGGFTLFEMIVVLAILGLVLSIAGFARAPVSSVANARATSRAIFGALREARGDAIAQNRSVFFILDMRRHAFGVDKAATSIPEVLRLGLLTSKDQVITDDVGRIRFDPDGGATGGRVTIAGGGEVWWVGVDWLSGRVTLAKKT